MEMKITIDGFFYLTISLFLLLLGPFWVGAAIFSAAIHELGHMIVLWICGQKIHGIHIMPFGARIDTSHLVGRTGICCALAGPMAGALLVLFIRWMPKIGICALIQTLFNLLPIYPLDGGRALDYWRQEKAVANYRNKRYNRPD